LTLTRALLTCGILSPVFYAVADVLAGLRWGDYSFRDQTISELGATGAPSQAFFSTLLVPTYLLLVAFGFGVWRAARGHGRLRLTSGLLVAFGVIALAAGPFVAMYPRGTEQGWAGALHLIEGGVEMIILLAAMAFAGTALGRRFRAYTIITVTLMLAFGAWSAMDIPRVEAGLTTPWIGVKERLYWYAYQLWFIGLALVLIRQPAAESPGRGNHAGRD
jgi:hypothetical membrane protein